MINSLDNDSQLKSAVRFGSVRAVQHCPLCFLPAQASQLQVDQAYDINNCPCAHPVNKVYSTPLLRSVPGVVGTGYDICFGSGTSARNAIALPLPRCAPGPK